MNRKQQKRRYNIEKCNRENWERFGTLYPNQREFTEYSDAIMVRLDLEREGHLSPDRIPPKELAELVRYGQ